jgi:hypothetical protein
MAGRPGSHRSIPLQLVRRRSFGAERGQAIIFVTMSLVPMLGIVGLVVDFGFAEWRKEACKSAAQSAALAGVMAAQAASNYPTQGNTACPAVLNTPANPIQAACLYAQQNGFTNGGKNGKQSVTVAANTSGSPVAGVSPNYWLSVTVSENEAMTFSAVLGRLWGSVSSVSAAGAFNGGAGGGCFYVNAVVASGTASLKSGCGVYVNGSVSMSGNASITTTGGAKTQISGTWSHSGSSTISPAPTVGAAATPNPFTGNLPAPPAAGSCQPAVNLSGFTTATIQPGTYCQAISMSGLSQLTLTTGTYVLQGGISMSGATSITATGPVTLYLQSGGISMSGTGGINLSAPTSGSYNGLLIWEASGNSSAMSLSGGSNQTLNGVVYVPNSPLTYSGGSSTNATNTTIVANQLTLSGTSYIAAPAANGITGAASGVFILE